jgi:fumarylacetoacetate (FAA) hydrolase
MFTPRDRDLERGWPGKIEGDRVVQLAAQTLQAFFTGGGKAREHAEYPLAEVRLLAPILHPPSIRDFGGLRRDEPFFEFTANAPIHGPDDVIPWPEGAATLTYELDVAAVVGGNNTIGGFTIVNDWSAPNLPRGKDRDFATSIGPVVVTQDELPEVPRDLAVRVNGQEVARAILGALRWSWDELVAHAARNTVLRPGELLAVRGVRGGPPLRPRDVVELEVEGIGILGNTLG